MADAALSISDSLADNRERIAAIFNNCDDVLRMDYRFGERFDGAALVVYCKSLAQGFTDNLLHAALEALDDSCGESGVRKSLDEVVRFYENRGPSIRLFKLIDQLDQLEEAVMNGNLIILLDGWNKALVFDVFTVQRRTVKEPTSEAVINGPREGTIEELDKNIALLRVRLKTAQFKTELREFGRHTKLRVMIGYVEDRVNHVALIELKRRLSGWDLADLQDVMALRELIEGKVYSPFPQYRITERPDVAVNAMLEGRILLMADGSGTIVLCPTSFLDFFQTAEDYYQRTVITSIVRLLRLAAFIIALFLPSIYIALSTFHPEMIPTNLLLTILDTREGIPFPALLEALVMQFFFELLREAGIRLPRPIGSAVSIVGALIIGEASIRAGVASPIMTVIIALTGIASFSIPQYELAVALRILVFPLMLLANFWGGFGLMMGMIFILLHLTKLRSLDQPYMTPLAPMNPVLWLDMILRLPLKLRRKAGEQRRPGEAGAP